jgi:hypothetical protein
MLGLYKPMSKEKEEEIRIVITIVGDQILVYISNFRFIFLASNSNS